MTAVFPSSSFVLVPAALPVLLAMLNRLLLLAGPIILCGRDLCAVSGDGFVVYMLCGRADRTLSGVAGGETAMAIDMTAGDATALD